MSYHLISGGAGFIGANLAAALLARGDRVLSFDDLSRGALSNLSGVIDHPSFVFDAIDCSDLGALRHRLSDLDQPLTDVWHMAANSDIPAGIMDATVDLHRTFMTTFALVEMMKDHGGAALHFASSSAIYGDLGEAIIHEDIGPLLPISNYGAMKLASEVQIRAAVEAFLPRANIFRFPNVIGVPATHGVILDFVRKLGVTPTELQVLGNGTQRKAYLHVDDLVTAMLHIRGLEGRHLVFNIGPRDDGVTVRRIAEIVRDRVAPDAAIVFGESDRGWIGDVPRFRYSIARLEAAGWSPTWCSETAVARAVDEIVRQEIGT